MTLDRGCSQASWSASLPNLCNSRRPCGVIVVARGYEMCDELFLVCFCQRLHLVPLRVLQRDQGSVLDSITKTERLRTRINLQICFFFQRWKEKKRKNLGLGSSAAVSARRTRCMVNSCSATRRQITKPGRGLKPSPASKCCSRPQSWEHPGLARPRRGVLNPAAFPTQ